MANPQTAAPTPQEPAPQASPPQSEVGLVPAAFRPKFGLVAARLQKLKSHLTDVLPKNYEADRLIKMALLQMVRNPDLFKCSAESIAEAVMTVASWGLELGRTAHLVPYGERCTAIADYKGKVELAIRGGSITSCRSRIVYEHDDFEVEYGLAERLFHRPTWRADPGKPVGVYAVVVLPGGDTKFELMSADQVERIRQRSRAKDKGPWKTDTEEMWRKTAVHRLLKLIPQNPLLVAAFESDLDDARATAAEVQAALEPPRQRHLPVSHAGYDPETGEVLAEPAREVVDMTQKPTGRKALPADPYQAGDAAEPPTMTPEESLALDRSLEEAERSGGGI
jgi:recombination protein RecT